MFFEVLPTGENSAEQDRCIDGRNFRIPESFPSVHVGKMIEKSPMSWHFFPEKAQRDRNAVTRIGHGNKSTFLRYTDSGQAKPGGRDTSGHSIRIRSHAAPISDQTGLRACLFPKKAEISPLQFVEKLIVCRRKRVW